MVPMYYLFRILLIYQQSIGIYYILIYNMDNMLATPLNNAHPGRFFIFTKGLRKQPIKKMSSVSISTEKNIGGAKIFNKL